MTSARTQQRPKLVKPAPEAPAVRAVVASVQVTVTLGVSEGDAVDLMQPFTFQLPTRQMAQALQQVPAEIEAKRAELQGQIDAQAGPANGVEHEAAE